MNVCIENGQKIYIFKKGRIAQIVFWVFVAFCIASVLAFTVMFAIGLNEIWDYLVSVGGVIIALFFLFFIPVVFEKICKLYVPDILNIFLYTIPVFNLVIGHSWGVFYLSGAFEFDYVMHAYNGLIFVFLGISVVNVMNNAPIKNKDISIIFILFFAFCFSMFIEYMWEILEFIVDSFAPDANMQEWKNSLIAATENGYLHNDSRGNAIKNTMADMIFHAIATLVTCIGCYIYMKKNASGRYNISILTAKQVAYFRALSQTAPKAESPPDGSGVGGSGINDGGVDDGETKIL